VIVLCLLVLFVALATGIFFTAKLERRLSNQFAADIDGQRLMDTTLNLVITQITDATTATNRAWVTQPGLIRTFTGNRTADVNYRLYSADVLRTNGAYDPFGAGNAVPDGWTTNKALYTDINEPVPSKENPANPAFDRYPVFYPTNMVGSGTDIVAGYGVTNAPVATTGQVTNSVPMPVQWLYMLSDGTIHPGVAAGVDQVQVSGATANNPIVGRVAFWTDDECAKVNINTAAGGEFWTAPWFHTRNEQNPANSGTGVKGFGFSKPVRNEFQRYPGHPYTTDLRAVFPELAREDIYEISPRVVSGGSSDGLAATGSNSTALIQNDTARLYTTIGELFYSTNVSAGNRELFFTNQISNWPQLVERREAFITATSRAPELTLSGTPRVSIWPIDNNLAISSTKVTGLDRLMAFCSTIKSGASSYKYYFTRSSSLNATTDISLARNRDIFNYLQRECSNPFPGASGGTFTSAAKYGALETDQILTEIFDYIRSANISDASLPGWGVTFNQESAVVPTQFLNNANGPTFGFGRSLTVRQIGLLFICNASGETNYPGMTNYTLTNVDGTKVISQIKHNPSNYPNGNVTLSNVTVSNTISGVVQANTTYTTNTSSLQTNAMFRGANLALSPNTQLSPDQRRVQALLLLEFMCPGAGGRSFYDGDSYVNQWSFTLRDSPVTNNTIGIGALNSNTPLTMPSGIVQMGNNLGSGGLSPHPGLYGGGFPYMWIYTCNQSMPWSKDFPDMTNNCGFVKRLPGTNTPISTFPYLTYPVTVSTNSASSPVPTMEFSGATLAVDVWHPRFYGTNRVSATVSRTVNLKLLPVNALPIPSLYYNNTNTTNLMASATNWAFHYCGPFGTGGLGNYTTGGNATNDGFILAESGRFRYVNMLVSLIGTNTNAYDTVITWVPRHGDSRMLFTDRTNEFSPVPAGIAANMRHMLMEHILGSRTNVNTNNVAGRDKTAYGFNRSSTLVPGVTYSPGYAPAILPPASYPSVNAPWTFGDWDTGSPMQVGDGPLINKPDEGILGQGNATINPFSTVGTLFVSSSDAWLTNRIAFITPNRQLPSAVMFGSLPTGVTSDTPWQTLLFRPDPGGHPDVHPGAKDPADHLLLDLFWMPIAEPYPISEPFSTAGKINMNYQIIPFTYIERSTGMRAVLMNEKIPHGLSASNVGAAGYGKVAGFLTGVTDELRKDINVDLTLSQFQSRFNSGKVFITPSEITTMDLIPSGYSSAAELWSAFPLTGENIKERPYATIYPRLTTKSNVYNVHYRVQVLRKRPGSDADLWDEAKDKVIAQRRGNSIIERYLDMNRTGIPDYAATNSVGLSAETLYRFRILSNQEFNP